MVDKKARWQQRFEKFDKAYLRFADIIKGGLERVSRLSDLEKTGVVKYFEFTFQLAKDVLSDYLLDVGFPPNEIRGPKYVIRKSFQEGYISDGEIWMEALDARNEAVHIYREEIMEKVFNYAYNKFFPVLRDMHSYFKQEYDECDSD